MKTIIKQIKAVLNFVKMAAADFLSRANAIYVAMNGNAAYPTPPVDMATFKAAIDGLSSAIPEALDGGTKAIAQRDHQQQVLVKIVKQLGHYVEANCKDDMATFLSSGFKAASQTKTSAPPLSESIRRIDAGANSGQLIITIMRLLGASSYEVRWSLMTAGNPGSWTVQVVLKTRPPITVAGLTPGGTYLFQVRALTTAGYTDWSDPVSRICT